jgi:hypothetical protein
MYVKSKKIRVPLQNLNIAAHDPSLPALLIFRSYSNKKIEFSFNLRKKLPGYTCSSRCQAEEYWYASWAPLINCSGVPSSVRTWKSLIKAESILSTEVLASAAGGQVFFDDQFQRSKISLNVWSNQPAA